MLLDGLLFVFGGSQVIFLSGQVGLDLGWNSWEKVSTYSSPTLKLPFWVYREMLTVCVRVWWCEGACTRGMFLDKNQSYSGRGEFPMALMGTKGTDKSSSARRSWASQKEKLAFLRVLSCCLFTLRILFHTDFPAFLCTGFVWILVLTEDLLETSTVPLLGSAENLAPLLNIKTVLSSGSNLFKYPVQSFSLLIVGNPGDGILHSPE